MITSTIRNTTETVIGTVVEFGDELVQDGDAMLLILGGIVAQRFRVGKTIQLYALMRTFDRRYMPIIKTSLDRALNRWGRQNEVFAHLVSKLDDFANLKAEENDGQKRQGAAYGIHSSRSSGDGSAV